MCYIFVYDRAPGEVSLYWALRRKVRIEDIIKFCESEIRPPQCILYCPMACTVIEDIAPCYLQMIICRSMRQK